MTLLAESYSLDNPPEEPTLIQTAGAHAPMWPWASLLLRLRTLVLSILETMHDEMQDYFDERTEVWQEADRGQAMTQRIEAISDLNAAAEALEMA